MYQILAQLTAFDNVKQYGQLASRIGGAFIDKFITLSTCITHGLANSDYTSLGQCSGQIVMILFDSSL
jgi:hypothetical protein